MNTLTITPTYYDQVYKSWMREFCLVMANGNRFIQLGSKMPAQFRIAKLVIVRQPQTEAWKA
jgi:hypothetical protein